MIAFDVVGVAPAAKGSPRVVTRGHGGRALRAPRVLADGPALVAWERQVALQARLAMRGRTPYAGVALVVDVTFRLERPASHVGKRGLRPSAPDVPAVKPDVDKLARATLDPLTGVVFDDDARVVDLRVRKVYAAPGSSPGARVVVAQLGELEAVGAPDGGAVSPGAGTDSRPASRTRLPGSPKRAETPSAGGPGRGRELPPVLSELSASGGGRP